MPRMSPRVRSATTSPSPDAGGVKGAKKGTGKIRRSGSGTAAGGGKKKGTGGGIAKKKGARTPGPMTELIVQAVASGFGMEVDVVKSTSKKPLIHLARQLAWYLLMRHTRLTQTRAAKLMGVKNHKSVSRAVQNWSVKRDRCPRLSSHFPAQGDEERDMRSFEQSVSALAAFVKSNYKDYLASFTSTALRARSS